MFSLDILSADPALGRLDYASLSQQTLMEMVVENIENKQMITGSEINSTDISSWESVSLNTSDEVVEVIWGQEAHGASLKGTICLEWLPLTVTSLDVRYNENLEGTIDVLKLPKALVHLNVSKCAFTGEFEFEKLREPIESVILSGNYFVGSLNLEHLPKTLKKIEVDYNRFSGNVNLTHLPESLITLLIEGNGLSGELDLTMLPSQLETLRIDHNDFQGETDFSKLPESLQTFSLQKTCLQGTVFLDVEKFDFDFDDSDVQRFVPLYLIKRDHKGRVLLTDNPSDNDVDESDFTEFYVRKAPIY